MDFLIGFLGAVLAVGLFLSGGVFGWKMNERRKNVTAEQLTDRQKRQLADEQEAWRRLHNYSVEDAYAVHPRPDTTNKE